MANLTPELTREALEVLTGPDEDSSDQTTGERILAVPGGWFIINHASYRDRRTKQQEATAERVRLCRERKKQRESSKVKQNVTLGNECSSASSSSSSSSSSSGSESVEKAVKKRPPAAPRPDDVPEEVWSDWKEHRRRQKASTSATVINNLRVEGDKIGLKLSDVMGMQVTNGWRGFQAAWVKRPRTDPPKSYPNMPSGISGGALEAARRVDEEWKRRDAK